MKLVVFGLSISSAWGNGHATLLRGLFRALHKDGHEIHFFEKDTPYYASHRDAASLPYVHLHLYSSWEECLRPARQAVQNADVAMVTSYCPDGVEASALLLNAHRVRSVFYDMDTPVTLSELDRGKRPAYLPPDGLRDFDLVLSYTGGEALYELRDRLGARCVSSLYGWVDPEIHARVPTVPEFASDLSYLGTYSADRQDTLENLLIAPARRLEQHRFIIAGAMYPDGTKCPANIRLLDHVAPPEHAAFYSSSGLTLNVTRGAMARMGYCPSGRLFEAAACGTPVVSDWWSGLDLFFTPGQEIVIARSTEEAIAAVQTDSHVLRRVGERARERALDSHTAAVRARRLVELIENPACGLGEMAGAVEEVS
jgi:spore maturation protein CgeB